MVPEPPPRPPRPRPGYQLGAKSAVLVIVVVAATVAVVVLVVTDLGEALGVLQGPCRVYPIAIINKSTNELMNQFINSCNQSINN